MLYSRLLDPAEAPRPHLSIDPHTYINTWFLSSFVSRHSPNSPAQTTTSAPQPTLLENKTKTLDDLPLYAFLLCVLFHSSFKSLICLLFSTVPFAFVFIHSNFLSTLTLSFSTLYLSFCVGYWTRARVQGPEWVEFKTRKAETIASLRVISFLSPAAELALTYGLHSQGGSQLDLSTVAFPLSLSPLLSLPLSYSPTNPPTAQPLPAPSFLRCCFYSNH